MGKRARLKQGKARKNEKRTEKNKTEPAVMVQSKAGTLISSQTKLLIFVLDLGASSSNTRTN